VSQILIILSLLVLLTACNNTEKSEQGTVQESPSISEQPEQKPLFKKLPCPIKQSPPIKDKHKIKEMLLKSGKITADMSEEKVMQLVNDYIRKKQAASECKK